MSGTALFLDTNILLHYRRMDEVDWVTIAGTQPVLILIPPVVIRELDEQKETHPAARIRKRARGILSYFDKLSEASVKTSLRPNVDIEFQVDEPKVDFAAHKLDPNLADDVLIAAIIAFKASHEGAHCALVTADVGLKLKAKSRFISVTIPPECSKLAEEEAPAEKRVRDLEAEIRALRSQTPKLALVFATGKTVAKFKLKPLKAFDSKAAEDKVTKLRQEFPLLKIPPAVSVSTRNKTIGEMLKSPKGRSEPNFDLLSLIKPADVKRYNQDLEDFFSSSLQHLRLVHSLEDRRQRTISLRIAVSNNGTCPAEDIVVAMHYPDGFKLREKDILTSEPTPPTPPGKPFPLGGIKDYTQLISHNLGALRRDYAGLAVPAMVSNVSVATIRQARSFDVEVQIRKLNHGFNQELGTLYAEFDSFEKASSFKIGYRLHAANLPEPVDGELHVVVEKST